MKASQTFAQIMKLLALTDKVIAFSLVFNVFYGLLSMMLTRLIRDSQKRRNQVII